MTLAARTRRRGQPLVALAALLAGWVGLRVAVWEEAMPFEVQAGGQAALPAPAAPLAVHVRSTPAPRLPHGDGAEPLAMPEGHRFLDPPRHDPALPAATVHPAPGPAMEPDLHLLAGHQLLLMAGLGYLTLPEAVRPALTATAAPTAPGGPARQAGAGRAAGRTLHAPVRWSGDGWLLVRQGGGAAALASGSPAYGGSQAGAVVRFRLGNGSHGATYLYARATGALDTPGDEPEAALGVGLRPIAGLPVRLLAEARVRSFGAGVRARPAIAAVTELPPVPLPGRIQGEVYAQAGYVAGRDPTAFFDLQALAERSLVQPSRGTDLRVGGGIWAGGQRGAARLDLGPRVALRVAVGGASSRVALDWRLRVAGNAAPASGAALTVSAGF